MTTAYIAPRRSRHTDELVLAGQVLNGRVLVLEKEASVGNALASALAEDHDALALTSAREALEHLRSRVQYDVILCDMILDEMTGPEFVSELREISRDAAERVVFTAAYPIPKVLALGRGDPPCLNRPVDVRVVRALIRERLVKEALRGKLRTTKPS